VIALLFVLGAYKLAPGLAARLRTPPVAAPLVAGWLIVWVMRLQGYL